MHTFVYSSDFSAAKMKLSIHVIVCCFPHADPLKLTPQGEGGVVMRWCAPHSCAGKVRERERERPCATRRPHLSLVHREVSYTTDLQ